MLDERNMTRADLARKVWGTMTDERGYEVAKNRQSLSRYISGKMNPSLKTRRLISAALDVSYSCLFPHEASADRMGSGFSMRQVSEGRCELEISLTLPTEEALKIMAIVEPYTK